MYENIELDPKFVIERALALQKTQQQDCSTLSLPNLKNGCKWIPPPDDYLKFNVDGAMFFDRKKAGIGAIIRSTHGEVIMAVAF